MKKIIGVVKTDSMDKTRKIEITSIHRHPMYSKVFKTTNCVLAHDEKNEAKLGDKVEIAEVRPISKNKSWQIVRIIK